MAEKPRRLRRKTQHRRPRAEVTSWSSHPKADAGKLNGVATEATRSNGSASTSRSIRSMS
jgi:hypothetical protein